MEAHRLRKFENRVLRKILGLKRDKVTGEWKRLHNGQLNNMYFSPNIIRVAKSRRIWAGRVACLGRSRGAYRVLVGEPEGKRPLVRSRRRWEDNIKMDLQDVR
jgi:hypothetical protein